MADMSGALGEIAIEASLERTTFLVHGRRSAQALPRGQQGAHQGDRRSGADRRRPRLPVASRRTAASAAARATRTTSPASGAARRRSSRPRRSWSSCTTRPRSLPRSPRPRASRPACPPSRPATEDLMETAGIAPDETVGVGVGEDKHRRRGLRRRSRRVGAQARARRVSRSTRKTPRAACTTWR